MKTRRLALDALLTAVALAIYVVELQLPHFVPIPGVKLGLANIITLFSLTLLTPADAGAILVCRMILGSLFSGNMMALIYSASGGALCFAVTLLMRGRLSRRQLWVAGVLGAAAHNLGQIAAAILITGTPELIYYLPALMISGVVTGLLTGLTAQFAVLRLESFISRYNG